MRLRGASLSVTATAQDVEFADAKCPHTLANAGTDSVFFRSKYKNTTTFAGTPTELRALYGAEIASGEVLALPAMCGEIEIVCATGLTATVRVVPGTMQDPSVTGAVTVTGTVTATQAAEATGVLQKADLSLVHDSNWQEVDLPANCTYVLFNADLPVYVAPDAAGLTTTGPGAVDTASGVKYMGNIVYKLPVNEPAFASLYVIRATSATTAFKFTFFTRDA